MNIESKLKKPRMPNFLLFEQKGKLSIDVGDLTEEQALEYAEWMKTTFYDHWLIRKNLKK